MVLPYSSGTTGPPKGVALTHYNLVANMCQCLHPDILMLTPADMQQESTVAVLPFFHIYAMNTIMTLAMHLGAKIVTLPKFEPDAYILALQKYKVERERTLYVQRSSFRFENLALFFFSLRG